MSAAVLAPPSYSTASPPVPQPWHSPDRPSIPETVLEFWRCLQWRPELAGDPRETWGERRGPALGSWRTQGPTRAPRNDDISGEEAGLQWAAPATSAPFRGLVIPIMCLALVRCWDPSERGPVPNFVEFTDTSGKQREMYSGDTSTMPE